MSEQGVITVSELKRLINDRQTVNLIDVREPGEYALCHINGSRLIPLGELTRRITELDINAEYVVCCHTGHRSAWAVGYLKKCGFNKVRILQGGVDAWAKSIDSSMTRY